MPSNITLNGEPLPDDWYYHSVEPSERDQLIDHANLIISFIETQLKQNDDSLVVQTSSPGHRVFKCDELILLIKAFVTKWDIHSEYGDGILDRITNKYDDYVGEQYGSFSNTITEQELVEIAEKITSIKKEVIDEIGPVSGEWVSTSDEKISGMVQEVTLKLIELQHVLERDNMISSVEGPIHPIHKGQLINLLKQMILMLEAPFVNKRHFGSLFTGAIRFIKDAVRKGVSNRITEVTEESLGAADNLNSAIQNTPGAKNLPDITSWPML